MTLPVYQTHFLTLTHRPLVAVLNKPATIFLALSAAIAGAAYLFLSSRPPKFNLIIISVDTLRADRLGAYGGRTGASPNLDAFARSARVFDAAISQSPQSLPAHLSLFTSLYPSVHQVAWPTLSLHPEVATLSEILRRSGRRTAAFVDSPLLAPPSGLGRGFDTYLDKNRAGIRRVLPPALGWLRRNRDRPFFLFLHVYDCHLPYAPPAGAAADYRGKLDLRSRNAEGGLDLPGLAPGEIAYVHEQYDAEIRSVDRSLQSLFDLLDELGLRRSTIVVVLSTRGEELGERGRIGHQGSLRPEVLRVPLIVRLPGDAPPTGYIPERVELIDLLPTLLDLLELPFPAGRQGRTLRPLLEGRPGDWTEKPAFGEYLGRERKIAVYRGDYRYTADAAGRGEKLYRVDRAGGETDDIAASEPGETRALAAARAAWEEACLRAGEKIRPAGIRLAPWRTSAIRKLGGD